MPLLLSSVRPERRRHVVRVEGHLQVAPAYGHRDRHELAGRVVLVLNTDDDYNGVCLCVYVDVWFYI